LLDLDRWLTGRYAIPGEPAEDDVLASTDPAAPRNAMFREPDP
jgi:endogenous inhibitor of DNA gyrase (YacG/DUF329 family)